jgi:4-hydroxy-3-methylbut-2-enyl diphosphate reductase
MDVILAKFAGFCYGVRRAVDTVSKAAEEHGRPMYTLGPIIHNPQVVEWLARQGVESVQKLEEIPAGSIAVMPSHGVPRRTIEQAESRGLQVIDLTCPFVSKIYRVAADLVEDGYQVVIVGDMGHTEVRGIMSVAGDDALAVSAPDDLPEDALKAKVGIVSQTTQTVDRFQRLVGHICTRAYEVRAFNTICHATTERQNAALATAEEADIMVVVGGRNSANTRRLAEICADAGVPTHHVEVAGEIDSTWFKGAKKVGVTAGASTPDWIIQEVVEMVQSVPESEQG